MAIAQQRFLTCGGEGAVERGPEESEEEAKNETQESGLTKTAQLAFTTLRSCLFVATSTCEGKSNFLAHQEIEWMNLMGNVA